MFEFIRNLFSKPEPQKPRELRMYVLVRQDLAETYRMVQGAHAVAEYALHGINELNYVIKNVPHSQHKSTLYKTWHNQYLIFLGVSNLIGLREYQRKLIESGIVYSSFCEPDLDDQLTAIACIDTGEIFSDLPLAR